MCQWVPIGMPYPSSIVQSISQPLSLTNLFLTVYIYVGDITYLPTGEGWLYLAIVLDLCSRAVVGWSMADHMRAELVTQALSRAICQRQPAAGLIMHTDRGSQYGADSYQHLLSQHGMQPSMSRKGNCWDNAVAESFFHTLKTELVYREDCNTHEQAQTAELD